MGKSDVKIRTPDQRLRVFVSSTLRELLEERKAARTAIETIRLIPVMFELGARPHPPKDLYQAYLQQSHIFIGIYWQSYGWIAENEKISGLEDELLLSENFPRLIYVKEPATERDEKLNKMLDYIRSCGNVSYKSFTSVDELTRFIEDDLAILISERFTYHTDAIEETKKTIQSNLPANLTPLVGREKEKSQICKLILENDTHLVTITGPGGIGKTRLSIAAGKELASYFEDGVYFADLSGIFDENKLCIEIAKTFGITLNPSSDLTMQMIEFISEQKVLLIIDNFEQLSHAGSMISAIVTRCPNLSVIVTSRNPLELTIETEFNIDALSFPDERCELSGIEMSPSVMLFAERARSASRDFELNEENIHTVADICRLLGGIPLAIELAAVKVRMFSLNTIKEKLSSKLDLLSGGMKDAPERHRTMKAALEWSYDLLNDDEKKLFRRLAVFVNGFDYEAIEKICNSDIDNSFETIESLLTKNFFRKETEIDGSSRFSMIGLLHKYSEELFEQSGEAEMIRSNLANYYLGKVLEESSRFFGAIEAKVKSRWNTDIQNVMIAIETLLKQERHTDLIEILYSLWPVFWIFNHDKILEKTIDMQLILNHEYQSDDLNGKLNWLGGSVAMEEGDFATADKRFTIAQHFFASTNNIRGFAWANLILNSLKNNSDNNKEDEILNAFMYSAELFKKCKDLWGESVAMQYAAAFEMTRKNYKKAVEAYDVSRKLVKQLGSESLEGYIISMKALAQIEMKHYDKAAGLLKEATEILQPGKLDEAIAYCLKIITYYFFKTKDNSNAMFAAGICENIFSKYNFVPWHMLSGLFSYNEDKVMSLNKGELSQVFNKGMSINVYRAAEQAYLFFHSDNNNEAKKP